MLAAVPPERLATMNIRGKITALVEARLALLAPNRESLRRAIAILALPRHVIRAGKLGWRAADVMWRAAGDKATDYNHSTKRAMLGGIRSEERRVGKECVSTCSSRWSPYH